MSSGVNFFDDLSPEVRSAVLARARMERYEKRALVISHEERSRDAFIAISGRAAASIYSPDGKVIAYRTIEAGDVFGELSAIDGAPRSASIEAISALEVARFEPSAFDALIETEAEFAKALLRHLAEQSRSMTARIYEFSTMAARARLAAELLRLSAQDIAGADAAAIIPAPTHFELASRISSHREAVSREMAQFARDGLIRKAEGRLEICDPDGLGRLIGS